MKMPLLFVREEEIWHPHAIGLREREVLESTAEIVELESFVQPLLPESQLDAVLLKTAHAMRRHQFFHGARQLRDEHKSPDGKSIATNHLCITDDACKHMQADFSG